MSLAGLTPADLRALASIIEQRDPELAARRRLTDDGRERLADLLLAGQQPTVGFWRRHLKRRPVPAQRTVTPEAIAAEVERLRPKAA